jgi:hypothetical protein
MNDDDELIEVVMPRSKRMPKYDGISRGGVSHDDDYLASLLPRRSPNFQLAPTFITPRGFQQAASSVNYDWYDNYDVHYEVYKPSFTERACDFICDGIGGIVYLGRSALAIAIMLPLFIGDYLWKSLKRMTIHCRGIWSAS